MEEYVGSLITWKEEQNLSTKGKNTINFVSFRRITRKRNKYNLLKDNTKDYNNEKSDNSIKIISKRNEYHI